MDRLLHQDNDALDQNLFSEGRLDGCSIPTVSDLHQWAFLFTAFTVATQGLIYRNWQKATTRSGAWNLVELNTGKLTRFKHRKDWQVEILLSILWVGRCWPFLVGGVICLVNSVNKETLIIVIIISYIIIIIIVITIIIIIIIISFLFLVDKLKYISTCNTKDKT